MYLATTSKILRVPSGEKSTSSLISSFRTFFLNIYVQNKDIFVFKQPLQCYLRNGERKSMALKRRLMTEMAESAMNQNQRMRKILSLMMLRGRRHMPLRGTTVPALPKYSNLHAV